LFKEIEVRLLEEKEGKNQNVLSLVQLIMNLSKLRYKKQILYF